MKTLGNWRYEPTCGMGAAGNSKSKNSAATRGIAYHKKFYSSLRQTFPGAYPEHKLLIEPWFREKKSRTMRSPDTVILDPALNTGTVVEVKMNWSNGRDLKLINEYLPIVAQAFELDCVWPLVVTSNVRGYKYPSLLWTSGLEPLEECLSWTPGDPTPVALFVK